MQTIEITFVDFEMVVRTPETERRFNINSQEFTDIFYSLQRAGILDTEQDNEN